MYKIYEKKAESMLKKAVKLGLPYWTAQYANEKINRAKHYRREADLESAKSLGMRGDRFRKAVDTVIMALEISEEFIRSLKMVK
jgi:hypothetical protein